MPISFLYYLLMLLSMSSGNSEFLPRNPIKHMGSVQIFYFYDSRLPSSVGETMLGLTENLLEKSYTAEVTAKIFYRMVEKLRQDGISDTMQMAAAMDERSSVKKLRAYHQILIAKNYTGLKNLYKIVSNGYLENFYRYPRLPKTYLEEHREGLIVGSACEAGELYTAVRENKSDDELLSIAEFYDYLEIQPISNNRFLIGAGGSAAEHGKPAAERVLCLCV